MRKVLIVAAALVLTGCTAAPMPVPTATVTPSARPTASASATPDPNSIGPVQPTGDPVTIVSGLPAPWSMVRLDSGSTLISERDAGVVVELQADGSLRDVATIADVQHQGEGGLLGLEVVPPSTGAGADNTTWLYAYLTTQYDNRVERFPLLGGAGTYSLGPKQDILLSLAKGTNHNGGRIKLGPDGKLYVTVGDATNTGNSQNLASVNGKILRMNLDGSVPSDNPFAGSLVYSYGHRNPQGLAWNSTGQLFAAEFGQDTWDEFNKITAGADYGWPVVEGTSSDARYVNPLLQWATDDASPSGLAFVRDTFFMAGLGGERLWAIYPGSPPTDVEYYVGTFGRIRDVVAGPNGTLWILTNNTDGRGSPQPGDDRILQISLTP